MKVLENDGLRFDCRTEAELWRARTLLTKEPGTIAWLREHLRVNDVFYDIGANVGCYTLYAARIVGPHGRVYGFEPHPANAAALLRNIAANGYQDRVTVVTTPLGGQMGCSPKFSALKLGSLESGTSGTTAQDGTGLLVCARTSIDDLTLLRQVLSPNLVKIDVDGNEVEILDGMRTTLLMGAVRSLQVESSPAVRERLESLLNSVGYQKTGAHYTKACQQQVEQGTPAAEVIENAVFQRAA